VDGPFFVDTNVLVYHRDSTDPVRQARAAEWMARLRAWNPLAPDAGLLADAWAVEDRYRLSFRDTMIVAAARRLDCRILLTEDLQDGQDLDGLLVRSPFTLAP
jgi:predicted nucleic acid-binding protein